MSNLFWQKEEKMNGLEKVLIRFCFVPNEIVHT
jgi:hypothetical protein